MDMKLRSTYIYALLLGIVMSSCMFDYPDDGAQVRPPGEDEGDGLISIVLFADEMEHGTRAGEPT